MRVDAGRSFRKCSLGTALGIAAVSAGLIGGAWLATRGPDMAFVPQMAEAPVVLPDGHAIEVQKYEVTVAEWNRCHAEGACDLALHAARGADPAQTPATGLDHDDALQYLAWINRKARHAFRLPTSAEWSFMAKGVLPEKPDPIFTAPDLTWASAYLTSGLAPRRLLPRGSFSTNAQGVADLDGSVWEWTADCYAGEGRDEIDPAICPAFYAGGEHVAIIPYLVRDPARGGCAVGSPPAHLGMRLVSDTRIR